MEMTSETVIASKPTTIDGITFRSRLEGRFYEWMLSLGIKPEYEPDHFASKQQYIPDFWVPELNLYVEVKPRSKFHELNIFWEDVMQSEYKWICVDQKNRCEWEILRSNMNFAADIGFDFPVRFDIARMDGDLFFTRIYPEYVDLMPS
jgi:hypothetical protein